MNKYTIYCTAEQTKKALELGAPIISYHNAFTTNDIPHYTIEEGNGNCTLYIIPIAEQMIGWLKSQGFKFILSDIKDFDGKCWVTIYNDKEVSHGTNVENKELAAIDAALDYLSKTWRMKDGR